MKSYVLLLVVSLSASAAITVRHPNGTTSPYAEDQLQTAIDAEVCGDIIEIDPGAARHNFVSYWLRGPDSGKDCSSTKQYVTIRSSKLYQLTPGKRAGSADAANLAFIGLLSGGSCTVIETERGANYYRLQGLEIAAPQQDCSGGGGSLVKFTYQTLFTANSGLTRIDHFPHHITIDQCWIHGIDNYSIRDGLQPQGILIAVINSSIDNIRGRITEYETHAIVEGGGMGPIRIVNNKLSGGQIHVLWGGAVSTSPGVRMEDIEFTNNWLYRPFKWIDFAGTVNPTGVCPVDSDGHGATYVNTSASTYWECRGAVPGSWNLLANLAAYNALIVPRIPTWDKNMFEIKSASKVHIEGNLLDQAYSWNYQGQAGPCFLLNAVYGIDVAQSHLLIENNICRHAPGVMAQGGTETSLVYWEHQSRTFNNITLRNNFFSHIGEDMYTSPGFGDMSNWAQGAWFLSGWGHYAGDAMTADHNTFQGDSTIPSRDTTGTLSYTSNAGIINVAAFYPAHPPMNQRIINSVWTTGNYSYTGGFDVAGSWGPYAEMAANGVVDNIGTLDGMSGLNQHCTPGSSAGCRYTTAPTLFPPNCIGCKYPTPSAAGFTSYPDDLTLQSGSPLKGMALDGKDPGADFNMVNWATAGAQAGTMAPYLAMKIRAIIPASTSVQVRFSAIDLSNCTIAVRVYGFPLSTPVVTITDSSGTLDRLVTLTGLTANTHYAVKVISAGSYYREDEFRTP